MASSGATNQGHGANQAATKNPATKVKVQGPVSALLAFAPTAGAGTSADLVEEPRADEHFLPVTRYALIDRLANPHAWPPGEAQEARRFFRYLDFWRQQRHATGLMRLLEAYEPFSPDSDLFVTRVYTDAERREMKATVIAGVEQLVRQANYTVVPRNRVAQEILSKESHYGLDLKVDFEAFEELVVCYRGESITKTQKRKLTRFFRKQEFEVPIYRRMLVLFKLKSVAQHIADVAADENVSPKEAEKLVKKSRDHIPDLINPDSIYIKIFKNIPKSDVEMVFPNTEVKFRTQDKLWLGVTGGGAVGAGVFGAAGKLALLLSNPITAIGALGGLVMVLFRQVMNVVNQKQKYMQVMAQNLYFHAMADNRGAMSKLADRAAEEDFKEEILLYSVLAKEQVNRRDTHEVDAAIEAYIERTFGLQVDFELDDALDRLMKDGLVTESPDGTLIAKPPREAAQHIDAMWDEILDMLPDTTTRSGREAERPLGTEILRNGSAAAT